MVPVFNGPIYKGILPDIRPLRMLKTNHVYFNKQFPTGD
jgi:hypothetical protein